MSSPTKAVWSIGPRLINYFVKCCNFVLTALDDMLDREFGHAQLDSYRFSSADDGNMNSGINKLTNTESVLRRKALLSTPSFDR